MTLNDAAKLACPFCEAPLNGPLETCRLYACMTEVGSDRDHQSPMCRRIESNMLRHRLAAQSARLAAAESELRRLRRVIDGAPAGKFIGFHDGSVLDIRVKSVSMRLGCEVKLIPIDELEASE